MSKLLGLLVIAGAAGALAYSQVPEIRRYLKMKQM
ncbi:MAG: DUF6893 family small protein [Thermoleophilaceae bacterium]